jgi:hypothetical protein
MLLATLLCFLGFTALSLSMSRHYADLTGQKLAPQRQRTLRVFGWLSLLLSLCVGTETSGWGIGLVQWFAALMGSAVVLLAAMSYRPKLAFVLACVSALICPFAAVSQWLA